MSEDAQRELPRLRCVFRAGTNMVGDSRPAEEAGVAERPARTIPVVVGFGRRAGADRRIEAGIAASAASAGAARDAVAEAVLREEGEEVCRAPMCEGVRGQQRQSDDGAELPAAPREARALGRRTVNVHSAVGVGVRGTSLLGDDFWGKKGEQRHGPHHGPP